MNKIIIFLYVCFKFSLLTNNAISQTPVETGGFWIEVYDKHLQNPISKSYVTLETIQSLPIDSALTNVKNENTTITWYGARLCAILETLDISCKKIQKLSISAQDGYTSVVSGQLLSSLRIAICAYPIQSQTGWNENYGYMRLIFPSLRSMYWVNSPNKMVITMGQDHQTVHHFQFYFVDNEKLGQLIKKDLKGNLHIVINDLLVELNLPQNNFHVLTSDGLFREYPENKINRYLILNQQQAGNWEINGINVPDGLKTRQVFFLSSGNKGVFLKQLTDDEQQQWEHIFWQPLVGENFSVKDLTIKLVSNSGKRTVRKLNSKFNDENFSVYDFLIESRKEDLVFNYFEISW
jgi:hypothetical protein